MPELLRFSYIASESKSATPVQPIQWTQQQLPQQERVDLPSI